MLKYHLARIVKKDVVVCDKCPDEITVEMIAALDAVKEQNEKRARLKLETSRIGISQMAPPKLSPSIGNSSSTAAANRSITSSFFLPRTTPGSQPTLESFNEKKRKEADMAVRRFWYHNNISFNCAKSYFYQPMVDAIAATGPGYKAPSYNALRGKELDEELQCVKDQLESIKKSWKFTGCIVLSDGWTDQRGRTIINFVIACPKGTMFLKSIDASSHVKDAHLIFTLLAEVVEEVGCWSFVIDCH